MSPDTERPGGDEGQEQPNTDQCEEDHHRSPDAACFMRGDYPFERNCERDLSSQVIARTLAGFEGRA
jgi:hypothetical protein